MVVLRNLSVKVCEHDLKLRKSGLDFTVGTETQAVKGLKMFFLCVMWV